MADVVSLVIAYVLYVNVSKKLEVQKTATSLKKGDCYA